MRSVTLRNSSNGWRVSVRLGERSNAKTTDLGKASQLGRKLAWDLAKHLSRDGSPWELEYFKGMLGVPETTLGVSEMLADQCLTMKSAEMNAVGPDAFVNRRTLKHSLWRRGQAVRGIASQGIIDRINYAIAGLVGVTMLVFYLVRFARPGAVMPSNSGWLLAVHGEWTTRTRHVLGQLGKDFEPDAILVLGRPRSSIQAICREWSQGTGATLAPVIVPATIKMALRAVPRMLRLLREGMGLCVRQPHLPRLREHAGIVFRVLLGAVMERWWRDTASGAPAIVYGHTGTADTSLLEIAQQRAGSVTVHMVHGVATGPNFVGFSNKAVFRCGYDADRYGGLMQYGECVAPSAVQTSARRGEAGVLLFTNLAHPMNPLYAMNGIADELRLLRDVAETVRTLGPGGLPLRWKPHPVIAALPEKERQEIRRQAHSMGYEEIVSTMPLAELAVHSRWVLTTPSTVALDLLRAGFLTIVLDWQGTSLDTVASHFPSLVTNRDELKNALSRYDCMRNYETDSSFTFEILRPSSSQVGSVLAHTTS